jgi:secreted trypsin-like serine protease
MKKIDNRWTIVGIVSYGDEECSGAGGVYARVDYYYDWIMSHSNVTIRQTTTMQTKINTSSNILFSFKFFNIVLMLTCCFKYSFTH